MTSAVLLGRRLADLRRARDLARASPSGADAGGSEPAPLGPGPDFAARTAELARRLAAAVGGDWIQGETGGYVRVERRSIELPLDRDRLATLPDSAPPDVPLVCLDTETTGLATGTGTVAFLVGIGTWTGDRFRQVQLLLPDHAEEPALLDALAAAIPADAWLVTYNGRGFDWPLLVSRFRMSRRPAPTHAGHLDLLPFVRRVFRHRLSDARLRTVEVELLGLDRGHDVDGWEIPGRYLDFLRGGSADPLAEVVCHNHEDVLSLARLLRHAERRLGDRASWREAPAGDLAGLARAYRRLGRPGEALDCLDVALEAPIAREVWDSDRPAMPWTMLLTTRADAGPPTRSGGRHPAGRGRPHHAIQQPAEGRDGLLVDRALLLRRLGRDDDALEAWRDLAHGGGAMAGVAWIEVAKVLEHRRRDPVAASRACAEAGRIADRSRALGHPLVGLEADLDRRWRRLRRRVARLAGAGEHERTVAGAPPRSTSDGASATLRDRPGPGGRVERLPPDDPSWRRPPDDRRFVADQAGDPR